MISTTKKYRYSGGGLAKILITTRPGNNWPIISMDERGVLQQHTLNGKGIEGYGLDLIEVRPRAEESVTIDKSKHYRYAMGDLATVLCTDRPGEWPVASMDERGVLYQHTLDGKNSVASTLDLIELAPHEEVLSIDATKKYRYSGGGVATVLVTNRPGKNWPVLSMDVGGVFYEHSQDGKGPVDFGFDLIEDASHGGV